MSARCENGGKDGRVGDSRCVKGDRTVSACSKSSCSSLGQAILGKH
jgi:hypothetical protein